MELIYSVQNYDWGKKGPNSVVAKLKGNVDYNFEIKEDTPYAELWLGTHVNGPSLIKTTNEPLLSFINNNPKCLGEKVVENFGAQLPFLFKILSVNKALSIQAHPSKAYAEELHSKFPQIYKDPNHKPELAVALTPFEALCGFRPFNEILNFLDEIPELRSVIGQEILSLDKENETFLQKAFGALFRAPKDLIRTELRKLIERFKNDQKARAEQMGDLIETLYSHYPDDVGCFVVYFLNYLKLKPFQSIYLAANVPHAYLFGDCVECMACSDNVVRAGLTPKLIDVETLCSMLIYEGKKPSEVIFKPQKEDDYCEIYQPPVPDFALVQIKLNGVEEYELKARMSASTLLVIEGNGNSKDIELKSGTAVFLPANESLKITNIRDLLIYQALANI